MPTMTMGSHRSGCSAVTSRSFPGRPAHAVPAAASAAAIVPAAGAGPQSPRKPGPLLDGGGMLGS